MPGGDPNATAPNRGLSAAASSASQGPGQLNVAGLGDLDEPEPSLREPLVPDGPRLGVALLRDGDLGRVDLQD